MKLFCKLPAAVIAALLAGSAAADVDVENTEADGFILSAYAKVRYSEFGGPLTVPDRSFSIESAGISADFDVSNEISGQLQLEARPGEIFLKDCFLDWEPFSFAGLQAGLFKKPFCLSTIAGAGDLLSIDRPITDGKLEDLFYSGRDIGAALLLDPGSGYMPELSLGVFNGSADPQNQDNELQYTARMEMKLPAGVTFGADVSALRFGEPDIESVSGYTVSSRQKAYGLDLRFETDLNNDLAMMLCGELVRGDNWEEADVIHGAEAPSFQTWWATWGLTWETDAPALDAVSASVSMGSWRPDRSLSPREDELIVTIGADTGTPVSLQVAAVSHMPEDNPSERDRTDYIVEMALDL